MTVWILPREVQSAVDDAIVRRRQLSHTVELPEEPLVGGKKKPLSVVDGTAVIEVDGLLTKRPSWIASWLGYANTTYGEIADQLIEANADPRVNNIHMRFLASPGGQYSGLIPTMDMIRDSEKPVIATVDDMATSAAYGLASQASKLYASHRSASLGSIGVAVDMQVFDSDVSISSTEAPKKRPDVRTPEGKAAVQEYLDELHTVFVDAIAAGRKTTRKIVNKTYGRGATVLADYALSVGMIDGIMGEKQSATSGEKKTKGGIRMDLQTLQTDHPSVYAAAVEAGVREERDRVVAHLIMGEASGDMDTAIEAVKTGDPMTAALQATYLAAGMNRRAVELRADDNPDVGEPVADMTTEDDFGAKVFALVERQLGGVSNG